MENMRDILNALLSTNANDNKNINLGSSGSGKSFAVKRILNIYDLKGEYLPLAKAFHEQLTEKLSILPTHSASRLRLI